MQSFFSADFFVENRRRLRQVLGSDTPIVITGNGVMQRGGDEPSPFYQDSSFWYLTGLNAPDLTLVMTTRETYLIVPTLGFVRAAFDGAHDTAAYGARSGITRFFDEREGWDQIKEELRTAGQVATLGSPPPRQRHYGIYTLPYRRRLITRLQRSRPGLTVRDIRPELANMRCIKQPEELQALQRAATITCETLADITTPVVLGTLRHEYELEAALSYGFRRRGSEGHAFAPIVGAGRHGTTLHYLENTGPIAPADLIVLDVGASVEHYSADVTRTVSQTPLQGRRADVYKAVMAVQNYALGLIRPGLLMHEYELAVEAFMGKQLQHLRLIKHASRANIRHYYPHATSHFLGLDTHDVGDYGQPLQPGMVITCEPGIYIPEEGIGVRIEDDVLLTKTGHRILSDACPAQAL
jgi:Xaa-Pro aminopeptidase